MGMNRGNNREIIFKDEEHDFIWLGDGTLVEVDREVYLEWYRSKRRKRYQRDRDRKYGLCSIEKLHEKDISMNNLFMPEI